MDGIRYEIIWNNCDKEVEGIEEKKSWRADLHEEEENHRKTDSYT